VASVKNSRVGDYTGFIFVINNGYCCNMMLFQQFLHAIWNIASEFFIFQHENA